MPISPTIRHHGHYQVGQAVYIRGQRETRLGILLEGGADDALLLRVAVPGLPPFKTAASRLTLASHLKKSSHAQLTQLRQQFVKNGGQ